MISNALGSAPDDVGFKAIYSGVVCFLCRPYGSYHDLGGIFIRHPSESRWLIDQRTGGSGTSSHGS